MKTEDQSRSWVRPLQVYRGIPRGFLEEFPWDLRSLAGSFVGLYTRLCEIQHKCHFGHSGKRVELKATWRNWAFLAWVVDEITGRGGDQDGWAPYEWWDRLREFLPGHGIWRHIGKEPRDLPGRLICPPHVNHHIGDHRRQHSGRSVRLHLQTLAGCSELLHCLPGVFRSGSGHLRHAIQHRQLGHRSLDVRSCLLQHVAHLWHPHVHRLHTQLMCHRCRQVINTYSILDRCLVKWIYNINSFVSGEDEYRV